MPATRFFSGIDVGTSSLKAVTIAVTGKRCKTIWTKTHAYNKKGLPDRNSIRWCAIAKKVVKELLAHQIPEAIGFTGQMHTLYAEDTHRTLCSPVLLWCDMHGSECLNAFSITRKEFVAITGNIPLPDFTLAKWLYAVHIDPFVKKKVHRLLCAKDIVRQHLSVDFDFVIDSNEATGTQLYDIKKRIWSQKILKAANIFSHIVPPVVDSRTVVGNLDVSNFLSSKKHLQVPLVLGSGDQATANRSVGAYTEGIVSVSLGTSGVVSIPVANIPSTWNGNFHIFPLGYGDVYHIIGTIPALGSCITWLKALLHINDIEFMKLAQKALHVSTDVLFFPYLGGTGAPYPNHSIRGQFLELSIHSTAVEIIKAVFLGIALEFSSIITQAKLLNIPVKKIIFSGGGTHIQPLLFLISKVLDMPCEYTKDADASAIGAALLAADTFIPTNIAVSNTKDIIADIPTISQEYKNIWNKIQSTLIKKAPLRKEKLRD